MILEYKCYLHTNNICSSNHMCGKQDEIKKYFKKAQNLS